jgi:hypothetical protein
MLGLVAEFGGTHNGNATVFGVATHLDQTQFTYQFGPRVSFHTGRRFKPFAELFIGGAHNSRSFNVPTANLVGVPIPSGITVEPLGNGNTKIRSTQNAFLLQVGGGVDVKISPKFGVRPAEFDYAPSKFSALNFGPRIGTFNNTQWQNNWRYTAGAFFKF